MIKTGLPGDEMSDDDMAELFSHVVLNSKILPMHVKRAKGLAGLLEPVARQEYRGFQGLIHADFEPYDHNHRFGVYRKSQVDQFLAPLEVRRRSAPLSASAHRGAAARAVRVTTSSSRSARANGRLALQRNLVT